MSTERYNASATALCNDIIAKMKDRPEMWQTAHPMYRNRAKIKNFWEEACEETGVDESTLRKKWKHLKDQYRKEFKRAMEKGLPEAGIAWQYYDALAFLRDEIAKDVEKASARADSEYDSEEEPEVPKVRIVETKGDDLKLNMIYQGLMETKAAVEEIKSFDDTMRHDPDYLYLMSLLPTLKQLTEIQKLQLRGKINEWLLEALTTNEYMAQCETKYVPLVSDVVVDN